jgi:RNA polymerase sigma-70 factor (ECF subfamily)
MVQMKATISPNFESVYRETYESIAKYVYFKVSQLVDAEDIVQEVYLRYYREVILKRKFIDHPQAYLLSMAANELKRYYADKAKHPIQLDCDDQDPLENFADETDVHAEAINAFTHEAIQREILTLPRVDQKILAGHVRFEMTFAEMASSLNLSENTVKTRYYRALKTLKQRLDRQNIR